MLDILDNLADPLAEVGDLAKDLGLVDSDDLDQATQMIQQMLAEQGLPLESYRFLHGEPEWDKKTSGGDDPEDYITQAGHIVDNMTGGTGYGKLGAAVGNYFLTEEETFELPGWSVEQLQCEEGLSRLFRCELVLRRPDFVPTAADIDAIQNFFDAIDFNRTRGGTGIAGVIQDVTDAVTGVGVLANQLSNPNAFLSQFSDAKDPDALDPIKVLGALNTAPNPADFLGKFCRVGIARRFRPDMFTISERWFSGVATEFEDLGRDDAASVRRVRIVIRPHLYALTLRKQCRVFQDLNAVEILEKLLQEHGIYQPGDRILAFLPRPGGKKLLGPVEVPDAAVAMVDKIGTLLPGGIGEEVSQFLSEDIEDWCPKRELCVQYNETDLEFVERLLAEEGISYFFESAERRSVLVVCDDPYLSGRKTLTAARVPLVSRDAPPTGNTLGTAEVAWELNVNRRLVPSLTTLRDAHLAFPNQPPEQRAGEQPLAIGGVTGIGDLASQALAVGSELIGAAGGGSPLDDAKGTEDYAGLEAEHFEYPSRLVIESDEDGHLPVGAAYAGYDGHPVAEHLLEGFRSRGATARGNSNATMLTPGHNVSTQEAPFDVMHMKQIRNANGAVVPNPQKMLVVEAVHIKDPTIYNGLYHNRFRAIHVNFHFHPVPRDKPRIDGVQTATVLDFKAQPEASQGGNEVSIDRLHRVLCRFHWDRRDKTATDVIDLPHTCWVRVGRPFAGAGQGVLLAPRPGMEAIVSFFDGDPDRPIVIGCVYNGTDAPNTFHPRRAGASQTIDRQASKLQSVWQTRSWPASGEVRGNLLSLDDHGKTEEIFLFAQKHLNEKVRFDHLTTVLVNQFNRVGGDHKEEVGADQTLHVTRKAEGPEDFSRVTTIFENEEVEIGKPGGLQRRDETVHGNEKIDVGADRKEAVLENETIEIKGQEAGEKPARLLEIHGNSAVKIREDDHLKVDGERIEKAAKAFTVKAQQILMGPPKPDGTRDEDVGLDVTDEGISLRSKGTVDLAAAKKVTIESETNRVLVKGKTKLTIQRGADVIVLDARDETIHIRANADGGLRLGTNDCFLELKNNEIVLSGMGTTWTTTGDDKTDSKLESGGVVTWNMEGEIHLNGADVKAQGG
jgi:uncharacterized protein involved in type VI secretion and phage assembly